MGTIICKICCVLNSTWGMAIISGIIATLLWWFISHVLLSARIKISNLQVYIGKNKVRDYYIRIKNCSFYRTVYDIECYCIFKDNNIGTVYIKESRMYKFTALGPRREWLDKLNPQRINRNFEGEKEQIISRLPSSSFILLNSQILKTSNGIDVDFSKPLNGQCVEGRELCDKDFEYLLSENFTHSLFVVVKTISPFGTMRTISKILLCSFPNIDSKFLTMGEYQQKKAGKFLGLKV